MSIFEPTLAMEYATGEGGIDFDHVTAPRPSCLDTRARICLRLREMLPDDADAIGGYMITRKRDGYRILNPRKPLSYLDTLKCLDWRREIVTSIAPVQLALPLAVSDAA